MIYLMQCIAPWCKSKTSNLSSKASFARRVRRIKLVVILGGILPSMQDMSIQFQEITHLERIICQAIFVISNGALAP
jgi:hypothetical protein